MKRVIPTDRAALARRLQEHGGESMVLVSVGDHEGYLSHSVVVEPVVATDSDEFASRARRREPLGPGRRPE